MLSQQRLFILGFPYSVMNIVPKFWIPLYRNEGYVDGIENLLYDQLFTPSFANDPHLFHELYAIKGGGIGLNITTLDIGNVTE